LDAAISAGALHSVEAGYVPVASPAVIWRTGFVNQVNALSNRIFSADMRLALNRAIIIFVVATYVGFTIIGVLRSYSPIPNEIDTWIGYFGFYADLLDGKYSAWFVQHHEHRPILPRVLIWLDIRYLGGRSIFLIAANLIMLCGIIATFIIYLRRLTNERCMQFVIGGTICITAASWLQWENLTLGYLGVQWFMAMLLPLVAFYWLARVKERVHFFWLALLAGVASAGTMANGIFVLPLLALLAVCIGLKPAHIGMLAVLSVTTIVLFLANYDQGSTLTGDPIGIAQYVLGYLGSPFLHSISYLLAGLQHVSLVIGGRVAANDVVVVGDDRAARLAAIPVGESPANRGVQSLL
jgi:hypothetical protein